MTGHTERLLPILIYIQAQLDADLSLDSLAERAELSPYHFHRIFHRTVGETVKQYVQRLRLERAAHLLKIQSTSIIDIAFGLGYQTHETFSRAFRRHFGISPKAYRQSNCLQQMPELDLLSTESWTLNQELIHCEVSTVQFCTLDSINVAFVRILGDYVEADMTVFARLTDWAKSTNRFTGSNLLMGIGHDDPNVTATDRVRYDACIEVDQSFITDGNIGYQSTPPGDYATVTYVGPYGETMFKAYRRLFQHVQKQRKYVLVGLPALEIYRTTQINPDYRLNQTDIYIPVQKKSSI